MLLTTFFVKDSLVKSNVSEAQSNLLNYNSIIANQVAPFISNIDNEYTFKYVDDIIKQNSLEYGARTLVLTTGNQVIVDSYDLLRATSIDNRETDAASTGNDISNIYVYGDEYLLYAAVPIIDRDDIVGVIFTSMEANYIFDDINAFMDKLFIIFSMAILVSIFISMLFADIISKPIERLTVSVKTITQGKYDTKVEIHGNDEIGELGKAFNIMTTKLYQVEERRKKFVSNVSHELRTPMTSMKIVSDTLLSAPNWDEGIYREFMVDINSEIDRLNKIIDSLLYLVRVEKDELELDLSMTYVNYLLEWVIKTLNPIALKKDIQLTLTANNKIQIQLDQEKMQQCLLNIIGNSVKYTPDEGKVWVELEENRDHIIIKVNDTGIGIPEKDLPFIFDRFYRVDEARARKTGGTGLGLSIAQQIIQLHQGTISVTSELGVGTQVAITLPKK
ncbi:MAG: hypothetical protein BGO41_12985 [Clostridiales bacterium 38-18]|nr:MAG: hypothetical protein BGO41_12985 [Clostridiales bacterium 38-18]